jgi:hypothetical protein
MNLLKVLQRKNITLQDEKQFLRQVVYRNLGNVRSKTVTYE